MPAIGGPDPLEWALEPPADPAWRLTDDNYVPTLEHEVESRFAVGNGFLGVRGSLDQPTEASRPRTYIAGLFDSGEAVPSLVSAPDWLRLRLRVDGEELSLERGKTLDHTRTLDFRRGLLLSSLRQRTAAGVTVRIRGLRLASLAWREAAAQVATIEVDRPCRLELEVGLGPATSSLEAVHQERGLVVCRVRRRRDLLAVGARSSLRVDGRALAATGDEPGPVVWAWAARPDEKASLTRVVAFAASGSEELATLGVRRALAGQASRLSRLLRRHAGEWQRRWSESDVAVEGDPATQRALRFAAYHLVSAADPSNERVSVGARALTGEAYKGHVFWDADVFLLPFYTFTWPAAARAMLMYRYHTLPAARAKAASQGYRGALYAWESADTGEETAPPFALGPQREVIPIRSGIQEHHISADVAYAVWRYWQATGDTRFLREAGTEILLETSRFWASRARLEADGRYHVRGVIGPDEYHESVDDNAYTNAMAAFNIECGLAAAELLRRRWPQRWSALRRELALADEEMALWREVQQGLVTGFDPKTGLFEQFDGFASLEEVDLGAYADRTAPMDLILGPERTRRSQVIKQADVVMLLALLGDRFERSVREANFRHYEARTGHGSSLSPPVHALVAARLGAVEVAKRFFDETAAIDLDDTMGNAAGGVHIGALGGLWQAAVLGFAGLQIEASGLRFEPHLPPGWKRLSFPVQWRRRLVRVEVAPGRLSATLERGPPMSVYVGGEVGHLRRGETWRCELGGRGRRQGGESWAATRSGRGSS